ncbi:transmembrane protein, putative [Medicago truncatula]|uniref:Transmembrane protein, putative n=1 Tax=Medicago truncatula TaxID=3880 RepID=A0A072UEP3_MEDTR|nr:transmembrane protein, putative [Medicago truncatula]
MKTPLSQEPAKYLRTLLIAVQCAVLGFCMNWAGLLVLNEMYGRVRLKYWRLPTSARYSVGDGRRSPESLRNLFVAGNGVDVDFVSAIPDLCSRSVIYFL